MSRIAGCTVAMAVAAGLTVGVAQTPAKPAASKPMASKPALSKPTAPPAIAAAFKKAYPKATIKNVIKEVVDGKTVYEVESVENGRGRNIDYNPDGTAIVIEDELTEAEFPAAVAAAIMQRYPKATITLREKLTIAKDSVVQYEAALKGAGTVVEVILTADGKWVTPK